MEIESMILAIIIIVGFIVSYILVRKSYEKNDHSEKYEESFREAYEKSNLPLIILMINGEKQWFLADSGASINLIKQSYFNTLKKKPKTFENANQIFTGSNAIKTEYCRMSLSYEHKRFNNEIFNIAQLNVFDFKKEEYGMDVVGILGASFFEKYGWNICFDDLCIYINK